LLVDKTDKLNQQAFKFEKQSKKLKNAMWWRNLKMKLFIATVVVIILYIILGLICGFAFEKCKKAETTAAPIPGRLLLTTGPAASFWQLLN
jgi:vesicle-associated membrane protein 7